MKTYRLIDIDDGFHCSIVGTCLSLEEVRKLLERCMGKDLSELSDYDLHRMALEEVRVYSRFSNKITEKLNSKYRADIFRASKLTKESELLGYWTRSFDDGLIAGPYWALLSHPGCTSFAANKAFGQVHMLSHLAGASYRVSLRELHSKEVRIKEMEAESSESLSRVFKISRELDHYKNICKTLKEELDCKEKRLKKMEDTIVSLSREPENQTQSRKEMESVLKRNETLEEKLYYMTEELFFAQEQLEILKNEKSRDPLCLCDDSCGYSLPADLKDRKVLLVGGRASMVPHCKAMIEEMNGKFLHHDGGKEQSRLILQNLVLSADIIICALDCVSHDASRCVKQIYRNHQQMIMMKNSGLSAIARELKKVV